MIEVGLQHSRPCPEYVNRILARFGKNPHGQPLYRVVWGPSQKEIVGGFWFDTATYEYRILPRYTAERWVLEKWIAPERYGTPESWKRLNEDSWGYLQCGDFPFRGVYETCHLFEVSNTFVPPEPALVWLIAQAIDAGKFLTSTDKRIAARQAKAKIDADIVNQIGDEFHDAQSPFAGPTIGYGGASHMKRPEDVRFDVTTSQLPKNLTGGGKGLRQL